MDMSARKLALATAACLAAAPLAHATIMLPMSLEDLAHESSTVVRARVLAKEAGWDEARQRIYTTTTMAVVETVFATEKLAAEIRVRTLGGEVGEVGMKVSGAPDIKIGEETLLFLRDDHLPGQFLVVGMNQGRFRLEENNGRTIAVPSNEGIAFASPGADGVVRVNDQKVALAPVPYADLKSQVIRIKASEKAKPAATVPVSKPAAPASITK